MLDRRRLAPAILMASLILLAYLPVVRAGFVWDDDSHITENVTLRSLAGLRDIWLRPGTTMQYYPLTFSAWWAGFHLWGLDPLGYHLTTLVLHVAVSLLLWRVLATLNVPGAWLGAMIFALHPVNVMSVAWATELKNTLSGSLALGACWAYLRSMGIGGPGRAWGFYALSLSLFVLALLAKTAVCFLPATLLLIVWWKKGRVLGPDLLSAAPMVLLAAGTGLITVYVEHHSGGAVGRVFSIPYLARLPIAGRSFWFYLSKFVFPYPLTFIYERWEIDPHDWLQWLAPAGVAVLLAALHGLRRRIGRGPLVAALHYFVGTSGLIFVVVTYMTRYTSVSDHWQYFGAMSAAALAGAAISQIPFVRRCSWFDETAPEAARGSPAIAHKPSVSVQTQMKPRASGAAAPSQAQSRLRGTSPGSGATTAAHGSAANGRGELATRPAKRDQGPLGRSASAAYAPGAALLLVLGAATLRQSLEYRDIETLWQTTIERNPRAWIAYTNLGVWRLDHQRVGEAVELFDKALEIYPDNAEAFTDRANADLQLGDYQRAVADATRGIELDPAMVDALTNRGLAYLHLGQLDRAVADLDRAVALEPSDAKALAGRGIVSVQRRQYDRAIGDFTRAIALRPDLADAYTNRGVAYLAVGKDDLAIADATRSIALGPSPIAYRNRALAYGRLGRYEEALRDDERAIEMDGSYVDAYLDRARCFAHLGLLDRARAALEKARELGGQADEELLGLLDRAPSGPH